MTDGRRGPAPQERGAALAVDQRENHRVADGNVCSRLIRIDQIVRQVEGVWEFPDVDVGSVPRPMRCELEVSRAADDMIVRVEKHPNVASGRHLRRRRSTNGHPEPHHLVDGMYAPASDPVGTERIRCTRRSDVREVHNEAQQCGIGDSRDVRERQRGCDGNCPRNLGPVLRRPGCEAPAETEPGDDEVAAQTVADVDGGVRAVTQSLRRHGRELARGLVAQRLTRKSRHENIVATIVQDLGEPAKLARGVGEAVKEHDGSLDTSPVHEHDRLTPAGRRDVRLLQKAHARHRGTVVRGRQGTCA